MTDFKQIENTNYYINKNGCIKNIKTNKLLKPQQKKNGYVMSEIKINNKRKAVYIHRLVAQTFLPNPHNYPDVHHIDNNKSNNRIDNLEWTTRSANCRMAYKTKSSQYPNGVSYNKVANKYQTQISINCKKKHLGYYNTIEEAHNKYLEEYKKIMGFECKYK